MRFMPPAIVMVSSLAASTVLGALDMTVLSILNLLIGTIVSVLMSAAINAERDSGR